MDSKFSYHNKNEGLHRRSRLVKCTIIQVLISLKWYEIAI